MGFYCYILECADGTYYTGWTIDPARRLRTALRIDSMKGQHRVDLGESSGTGELWAAMVDVRETLDRAVQLYANPKQALEGRRQRIVEEIALGIGKRLQMNRLRFGSGKV